TLTLVGKWLLVINTDAEMKIFSRDGGRLRLVHTYEIAESPVWAQPAWLSDGLLVKDQTHLARLVLRQPPAPAGR
ncbi:MAG: hypothetical protein MI919_13685, partial [Holophagales bacterium]|nr:hypothetical protein [Holophagales bacterium]